MLYRENILESILDWTQLLSISSWYNYRLSIASAHAFLLVYSITDASSFTTIKERFEEICEQRADFQVRILENQKTSLHRYWNEDKLD